MASPGNLAITDLATGTRATDALRSGARRLDPAAIREVARQFEAMFLREVLRDMRAGSLADDVLGSSEGDMYQQMFDAQMASSLARARRRATSRATWPTAARSRCPRAGSSGRS